MISVIRSKAVRFRILAPLLFVLFIVAYFTLGNHLNFESPLKSSRRPMLFSSRNKENIDLLLQGPSIDLTSQNSEELLQNLQRSHPSLPIVYWNNNKNKIMNYKNNSCAKYPDLFNLEFDNIYWQKLHTRLETFILYSAYYDVRNLSTIGPAVRILAMIDKTTPPVRTYCHIWFENDTEPAIVKAWEYKYIWISKWGKAKAGIYQPYLITCRIPKGFLEKEPVSVSLVGNPCDNATNSLRVIYNKPEGAKKKGFAVCVKGLDFLHQDISVRLVEWIELLGLLGAAKIFFYILHIHPNISKVLDYYEERGQIVVSPLTLPGGQPNLPILQHMYLKKNIARKRQNELIPYNDCLYKNLYTYDYITLLDTDEIIMPTTAQNWMELMENISLKADKNGKKASYVFRNVYFLDELAHKHGWFQDIPKYLHMMQHVIRTVNFTEPQEYVKCFHDPQRVLTVHNHFPFACLRQKCSKYYVETTDGKLQHYRADCVSSLKKSCQSFKENITNDTVIWRYKAQLIEKATKALNELGFLKR